LQLCEHNAAARALNEKVHADILQTCPRERYPSLTVMRSSIPKPARLFRELLSAALRRDSRNPKLTRGSKRSSPCPSGSGERKTSTISGADTGFSPRGAKNGSSPRYRLGWLAFSYLFHFGRSR
jgi:hypothetical protein